MKLLLLLLGAFAAAAAPEKKSTEAYISEYSQLAVREMERSGVPASITMAQAILESDSGNSVLAVQGRNHFGIKCHNDWMGEKMYADDDKEGECFRVYVKVEDSFSDHSDFLRYSRRYAALFELDPRDYKAWATGLQQCGYATSRRYAKSLIGLIERYGLASLDSRVEEVPVSPAELEKPKPVESVSAVYQEEFRFRAGRELMKVNGVLCVRALEGESYGSLAKLFNLFDFEILSFNDLSAEAPLTAGDIVFLARKKGHTVKSLDKHIVEEGDGTLRDICQKYGVREKAIRRLNRFDAAHQPSAGDTILLRR